MATIRRIAGLIAFLCFAQIAMAQAIVGGAGLCITSGNPNSIAALDTNTVNTCKMVYDSTNNVYYRWVGGVTKWDTIKFSVNLNWEVLTSLYVIRNSNGTSPSFSEGDGITMSVAGNTMTIAKASPLYAVVTVDSNRTSTFLAASVTPDTIDNPKLSQVGGVFSVVGNGIQYTSGTSRTFLITANADFKFSEANNIVKFQGWRSNGGTVIDLGTFGTVESVLGNETMHTSFSAITSLSNNDLLRFGFTPGAHTGDDTLTLTNLSITITQL
jgi:hypothetical protein